MLQAGATAPGFRLQDLSGAATTLEHYLSKGPVVLVFFKVSCPTCQLALPYLQRFAVNAPPTGVNVQVAGISQDDTRATNDFRRHFHVSFPMLVDEAGYPASNTYRITHVPSMFLVEKDSFIRWSGHGFNRTELERLGTLLGLAVFRADDHVPEWKPG
ncbi:MAG: TlpA family protein disulfide reductase [Acidobacteria bacterium]|nr:TlpA family protein disulfide reductase [Acidobacteriota bacterium]